MKTMKQVILLLFALLMALSAVACEDPSEEPEASGTDTEASVSSSDTSGVTEEKKPPLFDPEIEHKIIMDVSARGIFVVDLNKSGDHPEDWSVEEGIIWEWATTDAKNSKMGNVSVTMDSTRLRYSPYYGCDVVVFCGSGGWVGIVSYETKELLFEDKPGNGPHSAELLPNGDLILACSGNSNTDNGCILYYPLSAGAKKPSSTVSLKSAHGVCYDPQQDVVWALGNREIIAIDVYGEGTMDARITAVNGMEVSLPSGGGHDLSPAYGYPGKYWVSTSKTVYVFDSVNGTVSATDLQANQYTKASVKGMAYFPDGTMVQTAHDQGGTGTYRSSLFRIIYPTMSSGRVKKRIIEDVMIPHAKDCHTYKVSVFTKDYQ
ncbi:MAG: hypothetical protein II337_09925 [Clostridia bacterium]|nr:hypothetical protein [Clostridia bacterium]